MTSVDFLETGLYLGCINCSFSGSAQHNFASPVFVWSRGYLQGASNNADDGTVAVYVSQWKDNKGTHNGLFQPGVYQPNTTSVTFLMMTTDCIGMAALRTDILE